MKDEGQCVRCGYCCKSVTCHLGWRATAPGQTCVFLQGDRPGNFSCARIEERPELGGEVAIGAGCSSSLFNNDREAAMDYLGITERRISYELLYKLTRP